LLNLDQTTTFVKNKWKYILGAVVVAASLFFVRAEYQEWKQHIKDQALKDTRPVVSVNTNGEASKSGEPQIVYVQGQNTHTQEIVYVPKVVDSGTSEQEKTDVEFVKNQGKVYVKVNGKEYEVLSDVKEDSKFQNGKLVITEQTEMRVNITSPKPAFNLGLGWSTNGPAAQINGPLYKNVSWWAYGDQRSAAAGIQFPIMK
jgi:hypothetical protein